MSKIYAIIILTVIAFIFSLLVYPFVLKFAVKRNILDNPDARKLQRKPIPVMGGVAVFVGIFVANVVAFFIMPSGIMLSGLLSMLIMLGVGCWDDAKDISPVLRFLIEILVIWLMMFATDAQIDNFHGLWKLHRISLAVSAPLSIVAGVGIINALNLIDGVNGYSSGYGMLACLIFAIAFFYTRNFSMGTLCLITGAALSPFFLHNVFGKASRMFIGDGGTLMVGTLMALCVFATLSGNSPSTNLESRGVGIVAFTLSMLGIPVFDTLRVMTTRIFKKLSPFNPDKTHLHHLFIDAGFSHIGTSLSILIIQTLIVIIWFLSWKIGISIDWQFYIVLLASALPTFVFYPAMRKSQAREGRFYKSFVSFGNYMRVNTTKSFKKFRKFVDCKSMGIDYYKTTDNEDLKEN